VEKISVKESKLSPNRGIDTKNRLTYHLSREAHLHINKQMSRCIYTDARMPL